MKVKQFRGPFATSYEIEEYFDMNIPKDKKDEQNQSYMDNITCFVIQLYDRPKFVEDKKEEAKNEKEEENRRMANFQKKGKDASNRSMKDLFSFFTNNHRSKSMIKEKEKEKEKDKEKEKEKKLENSISIRNLLRKKNK